jgi:RNA polymerase sigma-70 factor, ECF subfamily
MTEDARPKGHEKLTEDECLADEVRLRHYLLGLCQLKESAEIERAILARGAPPILDVIEDELVEEYVNGELSEFDRYHFEKRLLLSHEIVEKIRLAAMLLDRPEVAANLTSRLKKSQRDVGTDVAQKRLDDREPPSKGGFQFLSFDKSYLQRLRLGDTRTESDFVAYFSVLIHQKLRSHLHSIDQIEEARREIITRVLSALRSEKIRQPERLGSFVNSICNLVLRENYRTASRSFGDEPDQNLSVKFTDLHDTLYAQQVEKILEELSESDQRLLREFFITQRDKDDLCREFGVSRNYLRVLLYRTMHSLKRKR